MTVNALVHNCPQLPTIAVILRQKFSLERGSKGPQKRTIVDDCAHIAESGLKAPFEGPDADFPDLRKKNSWKVRANVRGQCKPKVRGRFAFPGARISEIKAYRDSGTTV